MLCNYSLSLNPYSDNFIIMILTYSIKSVEILRSHKAQGIDGSFSVSPGSKTVRALTGDLPASN